MRKLNIETKITNRLERSVDSYLKDIQKLSLISIEEEKELSERIQKQGDKKAVERLVEANLRFVVSTAKQYHSNSSSIPLSDLISAGNIGLIRAAWMFDHSRGFKFISYAVWWIRQSITTYVHKHTNTIHLPANNIHAKYRVKMFQQKFYAENGRDPTKEEIKENIEISKKELEGGNHTIFRSDHPVRNDDDANTGWEITEDSQASGEAITVKSDKQKIINQALQRLTRSERYIIEGFYGLNGMPKKDKNQLAEDFSHNTPERVMQINRRARKKLRQYTRLKEYM